MRQICDLFASEPKCRVASLRYRGNLLSGCPAELFWLCSELESTQCHSACTSKGNTDMSPDEIFNANILLVDDQQANLMLLEQLLEDTGYRRLTATINPFEVCALHRLNQYDLILLDLQLPGMDGFQVMEALKTNASDPYLPVIVITAQPGHKLRALQSGAKDFISKPFDIIEVRTRIRNVLEVRLLYKKLANFNAELLKAVEERTAELRESEARFRALSELASDWYWEQNEAGNFTKVSGPVLEMLGIQVEPLADGADSPMASGWNEAQRASLQQMIAAREPFLDFVLCRTRPDGSQQKFCVSGQPMFDRICAFIGYRGIGVEITNH